MAFELFQHPHAKKTRQRELALYTEFKERRVPHPEEDLYVYEKGPDDGYPVVLVHGWESNVGSLFAVANTLQENGFRVMVFSLPAHGKSKIRKTNMVDASRSIAHLLEKERLTSHFSMVTHSFGSGASTIALKESGFEPDKLIFLTTPDRIIDIFDNFREMIQLSGKAYNHLKREVEKMIPYTIESFNISDFLKEVSFKQLVIMHDKGDKVLPFKNATAVKKAIPDAELIAFEGKGHYRLLWDDEVINHVVTLLKTN